MHNSLLSAIVPRNQLSKVSGWSRAVGYLATLSSLGLVFFILEHCNFTWIPFANHSPERVRLCGPLVAIWFFIFGLPLYLNFPAENPRKTTLSVKKQFLDLFACMKDILRLKEITYFLLASILYIDALNTLTVMGGIYCSTIYHISSANMIIYGIIMSITAGSGAVSLGWMVKRAGEKSVLLYALLTLFVLIITMFVMQSLAVFVISSFFASIAIGIIYGASRSMLARIAPKDKVVEIFSLYAISGKITAFMGPFIASLIMSYFQNQASGLIVVPFFILSGIIFLLKVNPLPEALQA
jgi:UMF1 family MFS transporter